MEVKLINGQVLTYLVDGLEQFEKDKAIKGGLRQAVNVFRVKGRSNLRNRLIHHGEQTDHLMNSFANRVKRNKLGALSGFDRPGGNHAHLVDNGTRLRLTKGRGKYPAGTGRGIMPANRFWQDAAVSEESKAADAFNKGLEAAVDRIKNRL